MRRTRSTLMAITKQGYNPPQTRDPEPENRGNKSRVPNPVTESPVGGWGFAPHLFLVRTRLPSKHLATTPLVQYRPHSHNMGLLQNVPSTGTGSDQNLPQTRHMTQCTGGLRSLKTPTPLGPPYGPTQNLTVTSRGSVLMSEIPLKPLSSDLARHHKARSGIRT